ncbi:acetyltransferase [Falsiroseomonas bella]|uniref:Acetyltransferase n=1 Tax=Falsiroseomonas bella TaxID=2184016 RepID=A0A317FH83_9PROT|nr:CatB-related O-acetyltransferase [Falsiroseomonas bella]PWS37943.1 acetyltransferase [Falsiroseomonas bella]
MTFPDPDLLHPIQGTTRVVQLRPLIAAQEAVANVAAGRFTYYDDPEHATAFLDRNILYNFGFSGARLEIGSFCAIATGARFVMPDAMHAMEGVSTFPFAILGGAFAEALDLGAYPFPQARDTVVGHDVWIGMEALVMPGLRIGHGAVVAAHAVVTQDVPDYAVVAGNPARVVRRRFTEDEAARLVALAWWDWPLERIAAAIPALVRGGVPALEDVAARR